MNKPLICIVLVTALLITGCLPAVFVAGATAGGVVISDRRSIDTMFQDKKITYQAMVQINSEPKLKHRSHINVTTFNSVVLLVGEAQTAELKGRAYELVKVVPDIRRIINVITIAPPIDAHERSVDTWITTKVKTAMMAEKGLNSTQIKVTTEDGVVYLMGIVTHQQSEIAIDVARQVSGVRKVTTLFEIAN